MLRLSVGALRTRRQLFAGAVVAVALGVGLVQSGLQMLSATDRPVLPAGLSAFERAKVREGYVGAATMLGMSVMPAVFLSVFIVSTTFGFITVQRRREFGVLRLVGAQRGYLCLMVLIEAGLLGVIGSVAGVPLGVLATWAQSWSFVEFRGGARRGRRRRHAHRLSRHVSPARHILSSTTWWNGRIRL